MSWRRDEFSPTDLRVLVCMGLVGFFARLGGRSDAEVAELVDTAEVRASQWIRGRR